MVVVAVVTALVLTAAGAAAALDLVANTGAAAAVTGSCFNGCSEKVG